MESLNTLQHKQPITIYREVMLVSWEEYNNKEYMRARLNPITSLENGIIPKVLPSELAVLYDIFHPQKESHPSDQVNRD